MDSNRNPKTYILAIIVCISVAVPVLCLPMGMKSSNPSLTLRKAYAATFPEPEEEEEEVLVEDWALVSEGDTLIDVSNGGTVSGATGVTYLVEPMTATEDYTDVPSYYVVQEFDEAGLPIEQLDPLYFAPDDTPLYIETYDSILKEEPDMSSSTVTTLATGEGVTRVGIGDTWSKIVTDDGEEGYVLTNTLSYEMVWVAIDRTVWVDTDSLTLRAEPSTESEIVATLPDEARLHCTGIADKWYHVTTDSGLEGYVYVSYTTQTAPPTPTPVPQRTNTGGGGGNGGGGGGSSSGGGGGGSSYSPGTPVITGQNGSSVVSAAESLLGAPYVYCGESSSGVDCSGLVVYAYRQIGVSVPHYADSIASCGYSVDRSDIQPGDIVCYDYGGGYCGHVAIYVGGGSVIHASNSGEDVRYGSLDMMPIMSIRRVF
ncbi:MAG: C40 family peptidase [Clostridiales bacterium]|nr:C40 family peptidase [Clostridiales bacterium]